MEENNIVIPLKYKEGTFTLKDITVSDEECLVFEFDKYGICECEVPVTSSHIRIYSLPEDVTDTIKITYDELGEIQKVTYDNYGQNAYLYVNISTPKKREPVIDQYISQGFKDQSYREGRTYEDYEAEMKLYSEYSVTEMDTVKGRRERGKRLLTMILRRNSIMLMFLMPDGTAASVKRVFDYLEAGLGTECFRRLFEIILTDNGGEFKKVDQLERLECFFGRTEGLGVFPI